MIPCGASPGTRGVFGFLIMGFTGEGNYHQLRRRFPDGHGDHSTTNLGTKTSRNGIGTEGKARLTSDLWDTMNFAMGIIITTTGILDRESESRGRQGSINSHLPWPVIQASWKRKQTLESCLAILDPS
jgi:hypothetical protein